MSKRICSEKKLQVIFNGIDINGYEDYKNSTFTRAELNIKEDAFVVGMVGRMCPQKAPDIFIKVANLIKKEIPHAFFVIVGNGEQETDVRKYAEKNGLTESLLITGWVDNPMDYIELFDVALLLSRWEGFGLVLPEYMLAGKPIVASRTDAIPNIIRNQENGLLVDVDDIEGTYKAVMKLYLNEELREQLIKRNNIEVRSYFDIRRVASEHENLFSTIA